MKLRNDIQIKTTCGISVLVIPNGRQMTMVRLNETSEYLWNSFANAESITAEDMANALIKEYDIDFETASHDATILLEQWQHEGLIS